MKKALGVAVLLLLSAALLAACSSSDSGGIAVVPGGTAKILLTGGTGSASGGAGGVMSIITSQPKGVKMSKTGKADTVFSVPAWISQAGVDLGSNPATISADTTVTVLASTVTDSTAGNLYLIAGDTNLYLSSAWGGTLDDARNIVTGLRVNSGRTLTLGLNRDTTGLGNYDAAQLFFSNDVEIAGKLTTPDLVSSISGTVNLRYADFATTRDMGALDLRSEGQMYVRSTGSIVTKGRSGAAAGERGGDGGYIYLSANNLFVNDGVIDCSGGDGYDLSSSSTTTGGAACVSGEGNGGYSNETGTNGTGSWGRWLEIDVAGGTGTDPAGSGGGVFVNSGRVKMNGGSGSSGGPTAEFLGYVMSDAYNTGSIEASGGAGTSGTGGAMFDIFSLDSQYGSVFNSGTITKIGGNGPTGGASGGTVLLSAGYPYIPIIGPTNFSGGTVGDIVNAGRITVDAGSATVSGPGGFGGAINMTCFGAIRTSGELSAKGGAAVGAFSGGSAGSLFLQNAAPREADSGSFLPVRDIQVSGTLVFSGGNGGGGGGFLQIMQPVSNPAAASDAGIEFLGYASADLSGGDGGFDGGSARSDIPAMEISVFSDMAIVGMARPEGPIVNEIPIKATGGNSIGTAGVGGDGGLISWHGNNTYYGADGISVITNTGKIDVSGGAGGSTAGNGGAGGGVDWFGHDGVTNKAELVLKGGGSVGATGGAGGYAGLSIVSALDIVNSGRIDTTGGKGVTGGDGSQWASGTPFGAYVYLSAGGQVRNSGSIVSAGGAGTTANGSGGGIALVSEGGSTKNSGGLNVAAGSGPGAAGTDGQAWIDWVQVK